MNDKQTELARQLYRNLRILAALTVVFLIVLAAAPLKWHNSEWKNIQKDYNREAKAAGVATMPVALQQIWRPEINMADRCTSCHVGMGAAAPLAKGGPLFGRHPWVGHDVAPMGCTVCHRGQGRATTAEAAHGVVEHWEDPMLAKNELQASCGTCHGAAVRTPALAKAERGAYLFELNGCRACHVVDGKGGSVGPNLSGVALKGYDRNWQVQHLRQPTSVVEGSRMMSFGHLSDRDLDDILAYLDTLIGAPELIRGKAIAVERGCRGCHKIDGIGGDVGIDLNEAAGKKITEYDFTNVPGDKTLVNWQRAHLRSPALVSPGSVMPTFALTPQDEEALVTYILSLRKPAVPLEQLPKDTVLADLQARRDFPPDGAAIFERFCSACHGPDGHGQVMPSLGTTVPDLRNAESRMIMSPESLRYVIEHGRPGRHMPAWGSTGGGLTPDEIDELIAYLRNDMPTPTTWDEVRREDPDLSLGKRTFRNDCSACHGLRGEGTVIAPSLTNPEFLFVADDAFLTRTIALGRAGTAMPSNARYDARTVASLIAWIRAEGRAQSLPSQRDPSHMTKLVKDVLFVERLDDYTATGSPAYGGIVFKSTCAGCHGETGKGLVGPALTNPAFLKVASDGFLAGTIVLGRGQRAMKSFGPHGLVSLESRTIGDIISYLRAEASVALPKPGYLTAQGSPQKGAELFATYCSGCHGAEGAGRTAPALRNPEFLNAVTDGFLQATIVRGRPGTAMRSWARGGYGFAELEPTEINDIVTYVRSWQK